MEQLQVGLNLFIPVPQQMLTVPKKRADSSLINPAVLRVSNMSLAMAGIKINSNDLKGWGWNEEWMVAERKLIAYTGHSSGCIPWRRMLSNINFKCSAFGWTLSCILELGLAKHIFGLISYQSKWKSLRDFTRLQIGFTNNDNLWKAVVRKAVYNDNWQHNQKDANHTIKYKESY